MGEFLDTFRRPTPTVLTAEIALGVVAIGTIVLAIAGRGRDVSFYRRRFAAWWIMGAVFCLAVAVGAGVSLGFIAVISFLAIREYFTVVETRPQDRRAQLWVYLSIPVQYYWITRENYGLFLTFIPILMLLSTPLRMAFSGNPEGLVASIGRLHWGMMLFIFGISHLAYLNYLEPPRHRYEPGALLLFVVILTEVADVVQFLVARASKRGVVAPALNTRKTWLGLAASIAVTAALAVGLRYLTRFDLLDASLVGAGIAATAFAGGLVVTAVRRDVGAPGRDTRVLDFVDSHCYTAPLFFHLVYLFDRAPA